MKRSLARHPAWLRLAGCAAGLAALLSLRTFADLSLAEAPGPDDFILSDGGPTVVIVVDGAEDRAVRRAAGDLAEDIARVTGAARVSPQESVPGNRRAIIVGTPGKSKIIERLAAEGKLATNGVFGQWESYVVQVVKDPLPGVEQALVIAGSDRRGAIYGIYEVSETIGVSPWHWWADVPVKHRKQLAIRGSRIQGPPAVKYRGIFLNDEDWGLRPWAAKTFEPETGNIGPRTYAKVFELLLRLRANYLWPAMHEGTPAFNSFPTNKDTADAYGIVMGSSHCEQMLCNNVDEWSRDGQGEYNYVVNRDGVLKYWEQRVRESRSFESVFTVGMRGIHDGAMPGGGTPREQAERLQQIIKDQRELLQRWVNPNPAQVPQIFCPYKEVLALYRLAPDIPDDITLAWPDDNYGYVRQFSDERERRRSGGAGVYYHLSYWGRPYDYLWLYSTPPALVWEELSKAWDYGARTLWVINVGDLKPAEIGMEFALRLGWNPHRWGPGDVNDFLIDLCARDFGRERAKEIAAILEEYFRLNFPRRPEHMGIDAGNPLLANPVFSPMANGDEVERRLEAFRALVERVDAMGKELPQELRDAWFELVAYPVRAAALMNQKCLNFARYYAYSKQGRASAGQYREQARLAHEAIQRETDVYNNRIAGGKWRNMMSANPRRLGVFAMPQVEFAPGLADSPSLGIALEGSALPVGGGTNDAMRWLPEFNKLTRRSSFVDVFNGGRGPLHWTATPSVDWIRLSRAEGQTDERVTVHIDWERAPAGDILGTIRFAGAGREIPVAVGVFNPADTRAMDGADFVEDNRRVVMEAEHASARVPGRDAQWAVIRGIGYNGDSVMVVPTTVAARSEPERIRSESPCLQYRVWIRTPGEWTITVRTLPTWSVETGKPQRYAIALNDSPPKIVSLPVGRSETDRPWQENVLRNAALTSSRHAVERAGLHTVNVWMVDPGIVIDTIVADRGSLQEPGYTGPAETRAR